MELHEFITATLSEIQQGVQAAINNTRSKGFSGVINPVWGTVKDIGATQIQSIHFDVAVTIVERAAGAVDAGIKVVGVHIGSTGADGTQSTHVSHIQFSIRVVPPVTIVDSE